MFVSDTQGIRYGGENKTFAFVLKNTTRPLYRIKAQLIRYKQ
jgi:hypothetical protein